MVAYLDMLVNLEGELFKDGFYKAFVMLAGPCVLCRECGLKENAPCRFPAKMRPSMEACGIDVYQTASNNGFFINTLKEKIETQNIYCLSGLSNLRNLPIKRARRNFTAGIPANDQYGYQAPLKRLPHTRRWPVPFISVCIFSLNVSSIIAFRSERRRLFFYAGNIMNRMMAYFLLFIAASFLPVEIVFLGILADTCNL